MARSTFTAAFDGGECDECLVDFFEGDEIGYSPDGALLCEDCHCFAWEGE